MTTGHLSEMELQQCALDKSGCTKEVREHMEACESCQAEAEAYQLLFSGIKEQPKPVFDFDVSGLVLAQMPGAKTRVSRFGFPAFFLAVLVCSTIGIPLYLFRKNIWNMFSEISSLFMYTIVVAAIVIVVFRIIGMYKKYQRQMKALNFY